MFYDMKFVFSMGKVDLILALIKFENWKDSDVMNLLPCILNLNFVDQVLRMLKYELSHEVVDS